MFLSGILDEWIVDSATRLREVLEIARAGEGNQLWLSAGPGEFPALVTCVNGDVATVAYVDDDGVMVSQAVSGEPVGGENKMVTFAFRGGAEAVDVCSDAVLQWRDAVECMVEFLRTNEKPTRVRWREL